MDDCKERKTVAGVAMGEKVEKKDGRIGGR